MSDIAYLSFLFGCLVTPTAVTFYVMFRPGADSDAFAAIVGLLLALMLIIASEIVSVLVRGKML